MAFECVSKTDVGLRRKVNEDSLLVRTERGLWAVADGMGGHDAGDVASSKVTECLLELPDSDDLDQLVESLANEIGVSGPFCAGQNHLANVVQQAGSKRHPLTFLQAFRQHTRGHGRQRRVLPNHIHRQPGLRSGTLHGARAEEHSGDPVNLVETEAKGGFKDIGRG